MPRNKPRARAMRLAHATMKASMCALLYLADYSWLIVFLEVAEAAFEAKASNFARSTFC